jgi:tetratricopeptide (TPR) repeat protein
MRVLVDAGIPSARRGSVAARRSLGPTWRAAFAALALSSAPAPASAEDPSFPECTRKPTDADVEGAKGAHKAATQFFERADYDRAIQYWRDAYQFDCTKPALLLNVANAYEKKGDRKAAVVVLELYLARAPNAPDFKIISEKVANLKASLKPTPTPTPGPTASPTTSSPEERPPAPPPQGDDAPSVVPWVVVGVGGAAAIAGAVLLPIGLSAVSSSEEQCPDRQCDPDDPASRDAIDQGNAGRTNATIGTIALAAGGGLVVGGLIWQFAFNQPANDAAALRVHPVAGPGTSGVWVSGSF